MNLKCNAEGISVSVNVKAYFQFESKYQTEENLIDMSKLVDLETDQFPQLIYEFMKKSNNIFTRN